MTIAALAAGVLIAIQSPQAAPPAPAPQEQLSAFQMVLFKPGPTPLPPGADAQQMQAAHLALLTRLNQERVNLLFGPFEDGGDLRGIAILDVADAAIATKLFADDPFVRGGHLTIEVKPWFGLKSVFHLPNAPPVPERFVFGFLVRGTNTSHPPAEAQQIQAGHLAYMGELHEQGKLVVAGPFGGTAAQRGIVIYRVATVEEAKTLAAGDPAVKAGRLTIDARPWMTFKGIIR